MRSSVASGGCWAAAARRAPAPVVARASASSSARSSSKTTCRQREQQPGVAVRADGHVLVRARGLGAPRVDHDHAPAAADDRVELVAHTRRREHRPVRDQRVGPEHEQEAPCAAGRGWGSPPAIRRAARWRRTGWRRPARTRSSSAACPTRVEEALDPQRVRVREGGRVPHVPAQRRRAVAVEDRPQAGADVVERVVPGHAHEGPIGRLRSGCVTRSGSFCTSSIAMPLGQA